MDKKAENELMRVLGQLAVDAASLAHLNRLKKHLGRTDFEGTSGIDGQSAYIGDPGEQADAAPEPGPTPEAPEPTPEEPATT